MDQNQTDTPPQSYKAIEFACLRFARTVQLAEGSLSKDVLAQRIDSLQRAAEDALHEHIMRAGVADENLVAGAIDYLAEVHDGPWRGTPWFRHGLDVLLSVASPSGGLSGRAIEFLEHLQQGAASTLSEHVRSRVDAPLTEQEAATAKDLEEAAYAFSAVSRLLDGVERLHYNDTEESDTKLFHVAALAAPLARLKRRNQPED